MHQGKVISRATINDDLAARILKEIKKQNHFEIVVSREDTCFIENNVPEFVNHIVNVMHNTTQIGYHESRRTDPKNRHLQHV